MRQIAANNLANMNELLHFLIKYIVIQIYVLKKEVDDKMIID
jgi:hypothetical protein